MTKLQLFSQEAQELVKDVKEVPKETKGLKPKKVKKTISPKHKKEESIANLKFEIRQSRKELEKLPLNPKRIIQEVKIIDKDTIMREDLKEIIFLEDEKGRYRERIIDEIKKFGVENWFKAKGYPVASESVWKNRYTGSLSTLEQEIHKYDNGFLKHNFESEGYYVWENWLPEGLWTAEEFRGLKELKDKISELQKQIDERRLPFQPLLEKWKEFIVNFCKERGQEIDKIWFDESVPYDVDISIRLVGHRCWSNCVSFRFQGGKLHAFDSGFGGGTSIIGYPYASFDKDVKATDEETGVKIKEIMEKVFNKECDTDYTQFWKKKDKPVEHRIIDIDEKGWIIDK